MLQILKILIPAFLLSACSTMPSGPSVLADIPHPLSILLILNDIIFC